MNKNMTVKDLKECIAKLPDDMEIVIPVINYDNSNIIEGFRFARTSGILYNLYENPSKVICIATSTNGLTINRLINNSCLYEADKNIYCTDLLF